MDILTTRNPLEVYPVPIEKLYRDADLTVNKGTFRTINSRGSSKLKVVAASERRYDEVNRRYYTRRVFDVQGGRCRGGGGG